MLILAVPSRTEALALASGATRVQGFPVAEGALPPKRLFETACQQAEGEWIMPRLLVLDGIVIGSGGFKEPVSAGAVEIGYNVAPAFRGRGLATQAVSLLVASAFAREDVAQLRAETEWANTASRRVLEKNGFVPDGRIERDGVVYATWRLDKIAP